MMIRASVLTLGIASLCMASCDIECYQETAVVSFAKTKICKDEYSGFDIVSAFYYGNKTLREARETTDNQDNHEFQRQALESGPVIEILVANKNPYSPRYLHCDESDLDQLIPGYKEYLFYIRTHEIRSDDLKQMISLTRHNWNPLAKKHRLDIIRRYYQVEEKSFQRDETFTKKICAVPHFHYPNPRETTDDHCDCTLTTTETKTKHYRSITLKRQ